MDIIFASDHDDAAKAAQLATTRIPIVFTALGDPVEQGLIQSFARPGGNITGVADLHLELGPKRLEVFCEILPGLKRVLFLYDATDAYAVAEAKIYPRRCAPPRDRAGGAGGADRGGGAGDPRPVREEEIDGILAPRCCR